VFTFTNDTNSSSNFTFVVTSTSNYTVSPSSGTLRSSATGLLVNLTFTSTLGSITFTELPSSGYTLWVNGVEVVTGGTASSYTQNGVPAGTVSYEVQAAGYYTYFTNATVTGGQTTTVPLAGLVPGPPPTSWNNISPLAYILMAILAVLVFVFVLAWWAAARRRPPAKPQGQVVPDSDRDGLPPSPPSR
jgi:hypothetical protein